MRQFLFPLLCGALALGSLAAHAQQSSTDRSVSNAVGAEEEPITLPPNPYPYTGTNLYFEIFGQDARSVSYVNRLSQEVPQAASVYFYLPERFSGRIPIQLVPEDKWAYPGPFQTEFHQGGDVLVHILWTRRTPRQVVIQALTQALLQKLAVIDHGMSSAEKPGGAVPYWLELAIAEDVKTRLNSVYRDQLRDIALESPHTPLDALLKMDRSQPATPKEASDAYLFLRFLATETPNQPTRVRLMRSFLRKGDPYIPLTTLSERVLRMGSEPDWEMWWAVGFNALALQQTAPLYTFEESRQRLDDFSTFIIAFEGQDVLLDMVELWEAGDEDVAKFLVRKRIAEIRLELERFNPIYYNAALALGQALEQFHGDPQAYAAAHRRYRGELRRAEAIATQVDSALLETEADMEQLLDELMTSD